MRTALAAVAGLALGFVVADVRATRAEATPSSTAPTAPALQRCVAALSAADVERLKREIVAALPARVDSGATTAPAEPLEPPEPPPPTPEALAAGQQATALVDAAVAAGVWSEENAVSLRALMPTLPPTDRDRVLRAITTAVNDQRLWPSTPHLL
jgi:hypothetical protein